MISIYNFRKRLIAENINITHHVSELYDNNPGNVINLLSETDFTNTNNNKMFFKRNTIEHDNIICLPLGVTNETENNIDKISIQTKSILCSCQISKYTRSNNDLSKIFNFPFVEYFPKQDNKTYLENLSKSKYVLSPWGEMADCYRHWESMYLSAIPITIKHPNLNSFSDLPILFLDSWEQLTEKLLNDEYDTLINKSREKLDIEYWLDKMRKHYD